MKIVIKGAGDLATGIASRLYHAGHQIVMTEIAVPLTVRRSVALSRAVYENEAEVEDLKGVLVRMLQKQTGSYKEERFRYWWIQKQILSGRFIQM